VSRRLARYPSGPASFNVSAEVRQRRDRRRGRPVPARPSDAIQQPLSPAASARLRAVILRIEVDTAFDQASRLVCGPSSLTTRWNAEEAEYQLSRGEDADACDVPSNDRR
jgi:hypothetical protein